MNAAGGKAARSLPAQAQIHFAPKPITLTKVMTRPIAAIFDLDRTLLAESSGALMWRYLYTTGQYATFFRRRDLLPVTLSMIFFYCGFESAERAMQRAAAATKGVPVDEFWRLIERWFRDVVTDSIASAGIERLAWHRAQGHIPVICSASNQFSVQPVANYLHIEHAIYTDWLEDGGRLTGGLRRPVVYGSGKVYWMQRWAQENGVRLEESYFYTDDSSDLPLLEAVAHPTVVNPNRKLRRVARARGWPIVNWL